MVFHIFTELSSHHHNQFLSRPKENQSRKHSLLIIPNPQPQPLTTTNLLSVFGFAYSGHFMINGTIRDVAFGERLLSLSVLFSSLIHVAAFISTSFLFVAELYCINLPRFTHSFTSRRPFGLFSLFGYCEDCYCQHLCASVCMDSVVISPGCVYTQEWNCWVMWWLHVSPSEQLPDCFPGAAPCFPSPPGMHEGSSISTPSLTLAVSCLFIVATLAGVKWYPRMGPWVFHQRLIGSQAVGPGWGLSNHVARCAHSTGEAVKVKREGTIPSSQLAKEAVQNLHSFFF